MEKSIKGTRTEQNLLKAFAGESQARSRYVFFASKAKKEGYEQIAGVFAETAEQEKEHAERFFKFLEGGDVEIERRYLKLLSRLTDGNFFKRDGKIWWQCRNCGFVIEAEEAPKLCPACKHPQAYFEPKKENY